MDARCIQFRPSEFCLCGVAHPTLKIQPAKEMKDNEWLPKVGCRVKVHARHVRQAGQLLPTVRGLHTLIGEFIKTTKTTATVPCCPMVLQHGNPFKGLAAIWCPISSGSKG